MQHGGYLDITLFSTMMTAITDKAVNCITPLTFNCYHCSDSDEINVNIALISTNNVKNVLVYTNNLNIALVQTMLTNNVNMALI